MAYGEVLRGSFLALSHTFHCYSLVAKTKTQNLWAFLVECYAILQEG
ncbi:hypothetical protein DOT_3829 [Desulfosporosinus sp. OT]|nr:hypothetical protein DOT_3829 [Desulfosporosinus sp. OT]